MGEDQFWHTTPAELNHLTKEYGDKLKAEHDLYRAAAYWNAGLSRQERMPNYADWMGTRKRSRSLEGEEAEQRQSEHEEIVAQLEASRKEKEQVGG